jgi:toxin ParE1/3/4
LTRVSLTKRARRDIAQAAEWYEGRREGLGEEFLDRVQAGVDQIALNPLGYAKLYGENRRCNLEQFPYALWFKIVNEVIVVGCLHGRRHPIVARERGAGVIEFPKPPEPS